ncbi:hypothetical protein FOCC_FOCC010799 [Frankliniella occidentalis]|nr:hypothetical protein FOCC_FOCC010799 [Frankliniella occidentalis]
MARNKDKNCGIASSASYPCTVQIMSLTKYKAASHFPRKVREYQLNEDHISMTEGSSGQREGQRGWCSNSTAGPKGQIVYIATRSWYELWYPATGRDDVCVAQPANTGQQPTGEWRKNLTKIKTLGLIAIMDLYGSNGTLELESSIELYQLLGTY